MKRIILLCGALALMATACREEAPAPAETPRAANTTVVAPPKDLEGTRVDTKIPIRPEAVSQCKLGTKLGADGTVAEETKKFAAGEPIHLSMWLNEAPPGLNVSLRILDNKHDDVAVAQKPASDAKVITLTVNQRLAPGWYRAKGYWGGNSVCQRDIEVR